MWSKIKKKLEIPKGCPFQIKLCRIGEDGVETQIISTISNSLISRGSNMHFGFNNYKPSLFLRDLIWHWIQIYFYYHVKVLPKYWPIHSHCTTKTRIQLFKGLLNLMLKPVLLSPNTGNPISNSCAPDQSQSPGIAMTWSAVHSFRLKWAQIRNQETDFWKLENLHFYICETNCGKICEVQIGRAQSVSSFFP